MSIETNKAAARAWLLDLWGRGDLAVADEVLHPDYVSHLPGRAPAHGREAYKQRVIGLRTVLPDVTWIVDDMIAEGDRVVTRFTGRGTHEGTWMGVAPTHRPIILTGISIQRFVDGRAVEEWEEYDNETNMRTLEGQSRADR